MFFISVADMRARMGFDEMADVNAAIEAALKGATSWLSSTLRTSFDYGSYTERFRLEQMFASGTGTELILSFKRGFLTTLTMGYASTRAQLGGTEEVDLAAYIDPDLEKGLVTISEINLENVFIRAAYTAGFQPSEDNPELYDADDVPEWLIEAASLKTMIIYDTANPTVRRENAGTKDLEVMKGTLDAIITSHVRYHPQALKGL